MDPSIYSLFFLTVASYLVVGYKHVWRYRLLFSFGGAILLTLIINGWAHWGMNPSETYTYSPIPTLRNIYLL